MLTDTSPTLTALLNRVRPLHLIGADGLCMVCKQTSDELAAAGQRYEDAK